MALWNAVSLSLASLDQRTVKLLLLEQRLYEDQKYGQRGAREEPETVT